MPNYRLNFKITGTTVPAMAGYYGADEQSTTQWRRAGGGAYAWKSLTLADTYFMGESVDLTAYETITVSGATDAEFDGYYIYNSEVAKWLKGTLYSIWKDTLWYMSDGVTTFHAPDNGLNTPPATFYRTLDYPLTITVSETGTDADSVLLFFSIIKDKPYYAVNDVTLVFNDTIPYYWELAIAQVGFDEIWKNQVTSYLPPKTEWPVGTESGTPAPSLEYTLEAEAAAVSCTTTASFVSTALYGTWTALGYATGTPAYHEYTIGEAWADAEETVLDSLAAFLGNTDGADCFRGYLPVNEDGDLKQANVWMLTSGGTAGDFDVERTYGATGNWCSVLTNGELVGVFENRITAMNFCGAVMAWLKETSNLSQTGNVNWCHLAALPEAPVERIIKNHRYWEVRIQLEILYLTEAEYGD